MQKEKELSRRSVLKGLGAGVISVPWIVPGSTRGANGVVAPSNRLNVGLIGRGCMGSGHLNRLVGDPSLQVMAVCDVDKSRRDDGKQLVESIYASRKEVGNYKGCASYNDFRELIARPDIDAVVIATADHWHTLASIEAAKAGKDVYCEKPVSLTIEEGRRLVDTMRRYGRIFQTGTQYRSIPTIRRIVSFIRAGGLGKIQAVFIMWGWVGVPGMGNFRFPRNPVLPAEPVPEGLDWNMWVGPAPWRPYNSQYHRNPIPGVVPWNFCEDFGAGPSTSYHSHAADVIQYAIGMEESGPVEIIHPSSGQYPHLTCRYANGVLVHHVDNYSQVKSVYKAVPDSAQLTGNFGGVFVGERGWITTMSAGGPVEGGPESVLQEALSGSRDVNIGANDHHAKWFEGIRTRSKPSAHEEIGHRAASLGHLVAISFRVGRSLKWDPVKEEFVGDEEANRLRSRAMREPWRI
ncbi:MAG: hypothetical protein A2283_00310 [Lentisphaerae bacterium RIFOXYA12_FULL_48_11]|nr:MAG: hypothetical protein A2283_00310 [Lentisphaerae bacterium RIFOXYA12_FULL_48_11]